MILVLVRGGGDSRNVNALGLELRNVLRAVLELSIAKLFTGSLHGNRHLVLE